jgi:glycogen synthase
MGSDTNLAAIPWNQTVGITSDARSATPALDSVVDTGPLQRRARTNRTRLRVLMATPLYLPHVGGVERVVDNLARRLIERGLFVTVLTTDPTGALPVHEEIDGVQILRTSAWPPGRDWHFAPAVYRTVARNNWDVVHVQSYHTFVAPMSMLAARRAGTPYVVTFHGGGHSAALRRAMRRPQWWLLRPLLAEADGLLAIAQFEIDLYGHALRLPPERFTLIPNGISVEREPRAAKITRTDGALIASVGRLERYKGHHRLIEALPKILTARRDARVWIAGTGPYENELRRLAARLGVAERVDIRAVPPDRPGQMEAELRKASLLVLLSENETQPLSVLEALALNVPALVTYTGGLAELADRGLVRSIPPESSATAVAAAVLEQLERPYVPERLDLPTWDDCADRHEALYLSVVERRMRDA